MLSIVEKVLLAIAMMASVSLFGRAVYHHYQVMRQGAPADRFDNLPKRFWGFLVNVIGQRKVMREAPGVAHAFVFWGFLLFGLGTANHFAEGFIAHFSFVGHGILLKGLHTVLDGFGVIVIVSLLGLLYRRFVLKPPAIVNHTHNKEAALIAGMIITLMVTYYTTEIFGGIMDPAAFIGTPLAAAVADWPEGVLAALHRLSWWLHAGLILYFLYLIPNSKHLHLLAAPFNELFRSFKPSGYLKPLDLENAETFGVGAVEQFDWKLMMDGMACTECGRCQNVCPAWNTGKPLSPKKLILDVKHHLIEKEAWLLSADPDKGDWHGMPLIGGAVQADEVWACTTCNACVSVCPVNIEHIAKIVDMRRHLTLMEGNIAPEAQTTFRNLEVQGNPWGLGADRRAEWADGYPIQEIWEGQEVDYLFFVGCAGSFDDRNKKVSRSLVQIMHHAGLSFAFLGKKERCNGDPARRLGNEYLFQNLATENVAELAKYTFKKVVTACPHCFNTLANEYGDFGGHYEVIHHTQLINELMAKGVLKLDATTAGKTTFHDPCYLGRHNGEFDAPRKALAAVADDVVEMERAEAKSFCCGAGGGRMWLEETIGKRVNVERTEEAINTGATTIATGCPFCMTMMTDGVKTKDKETEVEVKDIAELVAESLKQQEEKQLQA